MFEEREKESKKVGLSSHWYEKQKRGHLNFSSAARRRESTARLIVPEVHEKKKKGEGKVI